MTAYGDRETYARCTSSPDWQLSPSTSAST